MHSLQLKRVNVNGMQMTESRVADLRAIENRLFRKNQDPFALIRDTKIASGRDGREVSKNRGEVSTERQPSGGPQFRRASTDLGMVQLVGGAHTAGEKPKLGRASSELPAVGAHGDFRAAAINLLGSGQPSAVAGGASGTRAGLASGNRAGLASGTRTNGASGRQGPANGAEQNGVLRKRSGPESGAEERESPNGRKTDEELEGEAKEGLAEAQRLLREKGHVVDAPSDAAARDSVLRRAAKAWVSKPLAEIVSALVIIANSIAIAILVNEGFHPPGEGERILQGFNILCFTYFVLEFIVWVTALGRKYWQTRWGQLDAWVVIMGFVELGFAIGAGADGAGDSTSLSFLRVFRLLRLARLLKLMQKFRHLWNLIKGLFAALRSVLVSMSIVVFLLFCFGCIGVEIIGKSDAFTEVDKETQERTPLADETSQVVHRHFGSLFRGMATTLQIATYDNWYMFLTLPICERMPLAVLFFGALVLVVPLAMMNLVSALIVERAIEEAKEDREWTRAVELAILRAEVGAIRQTLVEADEDGDGNIDLAELEKAHAETGLSTLIPRFEDARLMFKVSDVLNEEQITIDVLTDSLLSWCNDQTTFLHFGMLRRMIDLQFSVKEVNEEMSELSQTVRDMDAKLDRLLGAGPLPAPKPDPGSPLTRARSRTRTLNGSESASQPGLPGNAPPAPVDSAPPPAFATPRRRQNRAATLRKNAMIFGLGSNVLRFAQEQEKKFIDTGLGDDQFESASKLQRRFAPRADGTTGAYLAAGPTLNSSRPGPGTLSQARRDLAGVFKSGGSLLSSIDGTSMRPSERPSGHPSGEESDASRMKHLRHRIEASMDPELHNQYPLETIHEEDAGMESSQPTFANVPRAITIGSYAVLAGVQSEDNDSVGDVMSYNGGASQPTSGGALGQIPKAGAGASGGRFAENRLE